VGNERVTATASAFDLSSKDVGTYNTTVRYTLYDVANEGLARNYTLADTENVEALITAKALSVSAPIILDKIYDGTASAGSVTLGDLSGFVGNERVTATASATALIGTDVGDYHTTVRYTLGDGANEGLARNYTLADTADVEALITAKALSVTAPSISDKTYDGTNSAGSVTPGDLSGFVGNERVTATASAFDLSSKDVDDYHTTVGYTLYDGANGGLARNYTLADTANVEASITAKALSVSGLSAANKIYDGTDSAVLGGTAALLALSTAGAGDSDDGKAYEGDDIGVSQSSATAAFLDKCVRA
jgi:hypothetical protein